MKRLSLPVLLVILLASSGCYHATVITGAPEGSQIIDKPWSLAFVYGLIPPAALDAGSECDSGVAKVETQLSFLNQLVSGLTGGIVTPMHITVTCAAGGMSSADQASSEVAVAARSSESEVLSAMELAVEEAVSTGSPVLVRFK